VTELDLIPLFATRWRLVPIWEQWAHVVLCSHLGTTLLFNGNKYKLNV
jgi:hypothetical protein